VSSYDGLEVKAVLDQIMSFQLIEDNTLLLSQGTNKGTVFYEYRVDTGALTELTSSVL
jgi:hypothetical protein